MALRIWYLRDPGKFVDEDNFYGNLTTTFSLKVNHGGYFTKFPNRRYLDGEVSFIDLVDVDDFSLSEMDVMMREIGYSGEDARFYHYMIPGADINFGLRPLGTKSDVKTMLKYIPTVKLIEMYVEHHQSAVEIISKSNVRIEEIIDDGPSKTMIEEPAVAVKDLKSDKFVDADVFVDVEVEYKEGDKGDEADIKDVASNNITDEDDEDYVVDQDMVEDIKTDEDDFSACVDSDVGVEDNNEADDIECEVDHDDFDSRSEEDSDTPLERALRKHRKSKKKNRDEVVEPFYVGQQFSHRDEVRELLIDLAEHSKRQLYIVKCDTLRFRAVCDGFIPNYENEAKGVEDKKDVKADVKKKDSGSGIKGGTTKPLLKKPTKTIKKKEDGPTCPFVLHVSNQNSEGTWVVKQFNNVHKCIHTRKVKLCTVSWLAKQVLNTVIVNPSIPLKSLQEQIQQKFQLQFHRQKVFRAKAMAITKIQGDYISQYGLLRDYCDEILRTNPGSTVKIDVERECNPASETRQFKRIYICLAGLKRGFKICGREILGLDGNFMKGSFPRQILTAVGIDSNNGIYPVAYALVEAETTNSWTWFLECLGDDLELAQNSNFTFISDRQKGIIPAVAKVFPCAEHRFCLRRIHENMKSKWRGHLFKNLLWKAATSTTIPYFDKAMKEIQTMDQGLYEWLEQIPPKHWSKAFFTGRATSDVLLNNICEVFNKQLSGGRDKHVITCLEYIREYLMKRIANVKRLIAKSEGFLTPNAAKIFEKARTEANGCKALWNGFKKYQVQGRGQERYVVDMEAKTCTWLNMVKVLIYLARM